MFQSNLLVHTNPSQEQHSVLHQLHRAIITSPNPLPDTLFTFCVLDTPTNNSWTFSRSNDPAWEAGGNFWVMPHFSFWSWPLPFIGTMDQALSKIDKIEKEMSWADKVDKAVWRGTAWFNSVANRDLRPSLVLKSKGKEWADVETLAWHNNAEDASNAVAIHDFCKYKYIIYTEGITYSGRLPFHQACASVIISPPIGYLLHTTHLIRPVFSTSFLPHPESRASSIAYDWWKSLWPHPYEASEANIVFVKPDWSDLEEAISYLPKSPVASLRDSGMCLRGISLPLQKFVIGELSSKVGAKLPDQIMSMEV
ncbi:DUF821 domain-containing protein [Rutstroemia sp. NJR-2017a BBW]|nr:DUF821 domain-containing protein [Rutstroemia sp. NJR-2017a BBW]